ncbi:MAG: 23S rRNA (guanosine(2251)-2'-O)-methyltransferase RlmB [Alphaproteobacteria bacterium]
MSAKHHRARTAEPRSPYAHTGGYWIYGRHAVEAALANPERKLDRLLLTEAAAEGFTPGRAAETVEPKEIARLVGHEAVHQGIAALVAPLEACVLEDVLYKETGPLVILDQVSDPHNVGAILRSAAAFDAAGVILPKDHSAPETAVMAKAASGALDLVKLITVTNLAAAMRDLKENGWWLVGLDGSADKTLAEVKLDAKTVLVLGAEGKGMRRLTAESCDFLVKLPMGERMESLNVSNAAAIALYHLFTHRA